MMSRLSRRLRSGLSLGLRTLGPRTPGSRGLMTDLPDTVPDSFKVRAECGQLALRLALRPAVGICGATQIPIY